MTTLEAIQKSGIRDAFPTDRLVGLESALVLFAAAFNGAQDACWIAEAGLTATCVDYDALALERMAALYPADWEFVHANAYVYASTRRWDVVTVDCPTGHFEQAAEMVDVWCRFARHLVVLGTGSDTIVDAPAGWEISDTVKRSDYRGGVYWTVLERA
jgi:hypothetical protein